MPRIYISKNEISEKKAVLEGERANHISRSLRMRVGDEITLCDKERTDYTGVIEKITSDKVYLDIIEEKRSEGEPTYRARLFMALPKSDKMELIVQKAVETGAYEIIPFISERCISRPDESSGRKKVERWNKIAESAAEQCGRGIIPAVHGIVSYKRALEMAAEDKESFICYEKEKELGVFEALAPLRDCDCEGLSISFFVGAEGGFSEEEANAARESGIKSVSLGKRILRCETAPMFMLSVLSAMLEK
ncbi:MAG: 16S rRNA (uracil(1498)-N(3))-methyltransferase [Ruminococcaceae bacterium]|nr:16S rRNA (uracil(1498)-N(3))-methyltransferase [Oscillospiraceae bacterium]